MSDDNNLIAITDTERKELSDKKILKYYTIKTYDNKLYYIKNYEDITKFVNCF